MFHAEIGLCQQRRLQIKSTNYSLRAMAKSSDIFRTLSNSYDEAFLRKSYKL